MVDLSAAAQSVWAKSAREKDGLWLPLWRHLADAAEVADWLWRRWLPANVRGLISEQLPGGDDDGRLLLIWLAGTHDIGKVSPAFAIQSHDGEQRMAEHGLVIGHRRHVSEDRGDLRHELVSYRALRGWLRSRGWGPENGSADPAKCVALVVGSHHGRTPESGQLTGSPPLHLIGDGLWADVRDEHLEWVADLTGVRSRLDQWRHVPMTAAAQVLLTGCVIVADWIASDDTRFDYGECIHDESRAIEAMRALGLPAPWQPTRQGASELFAARFPRLGVEPRPVQLAATTMGGEGDEPGLLIIEAPMGEGKTEAALLAAEIAAARIGAGGLLYLLPTRATASAMFGRVLDWLHEALPDDAQTSVVLAHAKAGLDARYRGLLRSGRDVPRDANGTSAGTVDPSETDTEPAATLAVHQWLRGRKKGMFANFAVGTVDQLLFGALKSKHLMLRHLAIASKVVVIDEVHSYDAYMSVYLERAIEWLGAYRVPVVMLSATLPGERRAALVRAYECGRRAGPRRSGRDAVPAFGELNSDLGYPVLVADGSAGVDVRPVPASRPPRTVQVQRLVEDDSGATLADLLRTELDEGGCAVVVRNSVRRVQQTADRLRALLPDVPIIASHARFVAAHRARNDEQLLELFGPDGTADRTRPHIVVASQVVEQSLDIDFDLMITDLAPVDLLLQRIGRLHRHDRRRAPRLTTARCLVSGVLDWSVAPPEVAPGFSRVYSRYVQLRTLAALQPYLDGAPIVVPDDIPTLVEQVYGAEPLGPQEWQPAIDAAKASHDNDRTNRERKARAFLLGDPYLEHIADWQHAGIGEADEDSRAGRAQVRDTDEDLEVLVVRRTLSGQLFTLSGVGEGSDRPLPTDRPLYGLARAVASSAISLPKAVVGYQPGRIGEVIKSLGLNYVEAWQQDVLLEGELLLVLDSDGDAQILQDLVVRYGTDGLKPLETLHNEIDEDKAEAAGG